MDEHDPTDDAAGTDDAPHDAEGPSGSMLHDLEQAAGHAVEQLVEGAGQLVDETAHVVEELERRIVTDAEWLEAWAARPMLRGWFHAAAVPLVGGATGYLVTRARRRDVRIAAGVYAASITTMLSVSAAYHRLTKTRRQAELMRKADHATIYAAVAGTMTPLAVVSLPPPISTIALALTWGGAVAGAGAKVALLSEERSVGSWGYITLGWLGAGMIVPIIRRTGWATASEIAAGGVAYTVGADLFRRKWPNPDAEVFGYHELWHLFVLAGVGLHLDAVRRAIAATAMVEPKRLRWPRRRRRSD